MDNPDINTNIGKIPDDTRQIDEEEEVQKKKIYSQFTPKIIECLHEVIKEVQKPLEDKLNTLLDVQNKQLAQDSHIKDL